LPAGHSTGALSDAYRLQFAMSVVPLLGLLAAGILLMAARTYEYDLKHVKGAEPAVADGLNPQPA
jgi:hypothetical protein